MQCLLRLRPSQGLAQENEWMKFLGPCLLEAGRTCPFELMVTIINVVSDTWAFSDMTSQNVICKMSL